MRVRGHLDGTPYEVDVTGDPDRPVVGSGRVEALVRGHLGRRVLLSPTGPARTVDGADPIAVLAVLEAHTTVTSRPDVKAPPRRLGGVS